MNKELSSMSSRIVYSGWDFQQALSALTFLLEECDFKEKNNRIKLRKFRCYETTMIVSFSRPFKVGRGREKLDLSEIGFDFAGQETELKQKIILLRDKVVSHSDEDEMTFNISSFKPFEDTEVRMPMEKFYEGLHFSETEYRKIEILLHRLLHAIAVYKFEYIQSNPSFSELKVNTSKN